MAMKLDRASKIRDEVFYPRIQVRSRAQNVHNQE